MSDEQELLERPVPDGFASWSQYWQVQGMPWRTEAEIDEKRQHRLAVRRGDFPEVLEALRERGVIYTYPFAGERLERADIEWLLATHDQGRGPVWWEEEQHKPKSHRRVGLDLRGARLHQIDLSGLPLAYVRCSLPGHIGAEHRDEEDAQAYLAGCDLSGSLLQGALLRKANLTGAPCKGAQFQGADLFGAKLVGANLSEALLQQADLSWADLHKADLTGAQLEGATLWLTNLKGADLNGAYLGVSTNLADTQIDEETILLDVVWNNAPLSRIAWRSVRVLGDETRARQRIENHLIIGEQWPKSGAKRVMEFQYAVQAYRRLSTALRAQGLNEHADRFSYRARMMERIVLRREAVLRTDVWRVTFRSRGHNFLSYLGSLLLSVTSGYGYKPMRSVATYLLIVFGFAVAYFLLGNNVSPALDPLSAFVFSITSFHGRGFVPGENVMLNNPLTVLAAGEAIIGLLIEITFIATFTQRFFAR